MKFGSVTGWVQKSNFHFVFDIGVQPLFLGLYVLVTCSDKFREVVDILGDVWSNLKISTLSPNPVLGP